MLERQTSQNKKHRGAATNQTVKKPRMMNSSNLKKVEDEKDEESNYAVTPKQQNEASQAYQ